METKWKIKGNKKQLAAGACHLARFWDAIQVETVEVRTNLKVAYLADFAVTRENACQKGVDAQLSRVASSVSRTRSLGWQKSCALMVRGILAQATLVKPRKTAVPSVFPGLVHLDGRKVARRVGRDTQVKAYVVY